MHSFELKNLADSFNIIAIEKSLTININVFLKTHWIDITYWKQQQKVKKKKIMAYRNSVGEEDGEANTINLVH